MIHTSSQATEGFSSDLYVPLSLVILAAAVYPCVLVLQVFCTSHIGGNRAGYNPKWIVTNLQLRCAYGFSLLLAIGLLVFGALFPRHISKSDCDHFHAVLLALLVSIPRVHTFYESQVLRLTVDSYRHAVWIGWGYGGALLVVLLILIVSSIDQAITLHISIAFSSAEYFVIVFGHVAAYRLSSQPSGRLLIFFCVNIVVSTVVGIIALTLLALNILLNLEMILFPWVYAIVTSLCLLRYLVFYHTKVGPTLSVGLLNNSQSELMDAESGSRSGLVDLRGGKTTINTRPDSGHLEWVQGTAYR